MILPLIAAVLLMLPLQYAQKAEAAENKTITLVCRQDDTILSGMEWTLYRIGKRNGSEVIFIPELSAYSMDLGDLSADAVDTAAKTIASYVAEAGLAPLSNGSTNTSGELAFGGLNNGLYLAVGKTLQVGNTTYFPSELLLEINDADAGIDYDAYPKFYYSDLSNQATKYTVRKVWADNDDQYQKRPPEITVDLFKDGALYQSVTLDAEDEWEYSWSALNDGAVWTVAEREIPADYSVMIDSNSTQFVIRNSCQAPPETTAPPQTTASPQTTPPPQLVQTGQLWWPVLPLSLGGVILIGAGISMRAGKKKDEE